ncbi:Syntenin-1, partial [Schistosoma japonicum]
MSLYPSLEELKIQSLIASQSNEPTSLQTNGQAPSVQLPGHYIYSYQQPLPCGSSTNGILPQTGVEQGIHGMPIVPFTPSGALCLPLPSPFDCIDIKPGVRFVNLCKNELGKVGIQLKDIQKGIFVSFVEGFSPAALGGVRFGDQVLEINDVLVTGLTGSRSMEILKNSSPNNIKLALRDRPFERVITVHKDNLGSIGIQIRNGLIKAIVKDSSAARNGILINHQVIEINGQNVVGLKDKDLLQHMEEAKSPLKVTIIPKRFYDKLTR